MYKLKEKHELLNKNNKKKRVVGHWSTRSGSPDNCSLNNTSITWACLKVTYAFMKRTDSLETEGNLLGMITKS